MVDLFDGTRENIIKYDSGAESGNQRIIILSTERNFEYLANTSEIFVMGHPELLLRYLINFTPSTVSYMVVSNR